MQTPAQTKTRNLDRQKSLPPWLAIAILLGIFVVPYIIVRLAQPRAKPRPYLHDARDVLAHERLSQDLDMAQTELQMTPEGERREDGLLRRMAEDIVEIKKIEQRRKP